MNDSKNPKNSSKDDHTVQERILDAAEKYFAENGYNATTVRQITTYANSNLAAVNYYFSSKENLYVEVFRRRLIQIIKIRQDFVQDAISSDSPDLEQILHAFAKAYLQPFKDPKIGQRFMKLIAKEMANPRLPKSMFVKVLLQPTLALMAKALRKIEPKLNDQDVFLITFSLTGQLLHVHRVSELQKSGDFNGLQMPAIDEMINHTLKFSMAGINQIIKESK